MVYSLKKGFEKGSTSAVVVLISMVAFAGFSDLTIWGLLEEYLKPVLGTVTVGGALTMLLNYLKVRNAA